MILQICCIIRMNEKSLGEYRAEQLISLPKSCQGKKKQDDTVRICKADWNYSAGSKQV